jgi:hypothetical protein
MRPPLNRHRQSRASVVSHLSEIKAPPDAPTTQDVQVNLDASANRKVRALTRDPANSRGPANPHVPVASNGPAVSLNDRHSSRLPVSMLGLINKDGPMSEPVLERMV